MKVLRKTTITQALFGQYRGYTQHTGVNPHSTTPTYAQITCTVDTPRWQQVPFIIQAGKGLDRLCTEIKIVFKQPTCNLSTGCPVLNNELIIQIAPQGTFELSVNIKSSYTKAHKDTAHTPIMPITLNFCYSCVWLYTPQAYRVIFEQLMGGKHSLSVPFAQIEQAWRIVDPIIHERYPGIPVYEVGTAGPLQKSEQTKKGLS
jgi:glucose-6-phosphate 1-dehydrogenase